jgi:hypothetical protein
MMLWVLRKPPADVYRYLLPSERLVVTVRRHPSVMSPIMGLMAANVAAFALIIADVISGGFAVLIALGLLFFLACYFLYRSVRGWRRTYFIVTSARIVLIGLHRKLTAIPVMDADDMTFIRTPAGRVMGYGSFSIKRPGSGGRVYKIRYMPYPEQLYLEITGLIFPEGRILERRDRAQHRGS